MTPAEAFEFGKQCRTHGLSLRDADLALARKVGIIDELLDANSEGWYDEEDARGVVQGCGGTGCGGADECICRPS